MTTMEEMTAVRDSVETTAMTAVREEEPREIAIIVTTGIIGTIVTTGTDVPREIIREAGPRETDLRDRTAPERMADVPREITREAEPRETEETIPRTY